MLFLYSKVFIMFKGKGLLSSMSTRTRRGTSRVSTNLEEAHQWEDDALYAAESLRVHSTGWLDPEVIQAWGMHEDFQAFATTTWLLEFSRHPKKTYKEISREFIATFRFELIKSYKESKRGKEVAPTFTIKFSMMNQCFVMSLEEFCNVIHIENTGRWDDILGDSNPELVSFWRSISVNVSPRLNRGKLTHIQHPALRYFALFLAGGFLARDNSSACTSPLFIC
jgi:hypothetical protein